MSASGRPESPKKDGQKRLGSLKSGFLPHSNRPGGLRTGLGGEAPAARPMAIKTEEAANGQATGPQNAMPKLPLPKKKWIPNAGVRRDPPAVTAAHAAGPSSLQPQQQRLEEEHAELIRQAQQDRQWERGGKKGPHSAAGRPNQASYRVAVAPVKGATASSRDPRTSAGSAVGGASRQKIGLATSRAPAAKVKEEEEEDYEAAPMDEDADEDEGDEHEPRGGARSMLDEQQYYPTLLPMRHPKAPPDDADEERADARPPDLDILPEVETNVAERLGLLGVGERERRPMFLLQLPHLLPISSRASSSGGDGGPGGSGHGGKGRGVRRDGGASSALGHSASSLRDLPVGKIGRLLVHKSGAVRLALGDVVLGLHEGTRAGLRQDVAAVSVEDEELAHLSRPDGDGVAARGVLCPDMDHLLGDAPVPRVPKKLLSKQAPKGVILDSDDEMEEAEVVVKDEEG